MFVLSGVYNYNLINVVVMSYSKMGLVVVIYMCNVSDAVAVKVLSLNV